MPIKASSQPDPDCSGILKGVDALIDDQLGLLFGEKFWKIGHAPHYKHRETCNLFKEFPPNTDLSGLAAAILGRIAGNYYRAGGKGASRSDKNWRCQAQLRIGADNPSIEKQLEKQIANEFAPLWVNQIPIASGLTKSGNRKNCIDLAWRPQEKADSAVLVELKWDSNNPVFAAFEVLNYGIVYLFARRFLWDHYNETEWMKKRVVFLSVLAPDPFYENFRHGGGSHFEQSLDFAIRSLANKCLTQFHPGGDLKMGFYFSEFPKGFKCSWKNRGEERCNSQSTEHVHRWPREQLESAITPVEDRFREKLLKLAQTGIR